MFVNKFYQDHNKFGTCDSWSLGRFHQLIVDEGVKWTKHGTSVKSKTPCNSMYDKNILGFWKIYKKSKVPSKYYGRMCTRITIYIYSSVLKFLQYVIYFSEFSSWSESLCDNITSCHLYLVRFQSERPFLFSKFERSEIKRLDILHIYHYYGYKIYKQNSQYTLKWMFPDCVFV